MTVRPYAQNVPERFPFTAEDNRLDGGRGKQVPVIITVHYGWWFLAWNGLCNGKAPKHNEYVLQC